MKYRSTEATGIYICKTDPIRALETTMAGESLLNDGIAVDLVAVLLEAGARVGAGTSGVEIAIELAQNRHTYLAGHPTSHIPDPIFRYAGGIYWWFISTILTTRTPVGRKARESFSKKGGPLIRVSLVDAIAAGVEHVPRVAGVSNGKPRLEDGRLIDVSLIVWATGFKPDFSWIELDVTDEKGWPRTQRGISTATPGLYFVGMPL